MATPLPTPARRFRTAITTATMLKRWKRSAGVHTPPSLSTQHLSPYTTPLATPSPSSPASWHSALDTVLTKDVWLCRKPSPSTSSRPTSIRTSVVVDRCVDDGQILSIAAHREPADRSPRGSPHGSRRGSRDRDAVVV
ncbi:uncharacterized protein CcaverHIS019_0601130 [Cutaneotrichosporon cavernicola]|uniref:Uncharacterized protein n=1 Tax=Cutaneotrichosporon cavernicola TaxID=279322 RepID=A0AA48L804_9TREE|nr:uncharacterized protein CcaverHIS019_0601130 [Cutaneotrichosporon cavernicola]BEI93654.1 hypothetical protein CcaverHIS019_0601130 [Cutaneotrichosporon cavernicola]BEJ09198.1 hypothetical protein CcaverHIS641_0601130 [Cutaneotrichosporon cavernicola]